MDYAGKIPSFSLSLQKMGFFLFLNHKSRNCMSFIYYLLLLARQFYFFKIHFIYLHFKTKEHVTKTSNIWLAVKLAVCKTDCRVSRSLFTHALQAASGSQRKRPQRMNAVHESRVGMVMCMAHLICQILICLSQFLSTIISDSLL